jgi:hypothetical protein
MISRAEQRSDRQRAVGRKAIRRLGASGHQGPHKSDTCWRVVCRSAAQRDRMGGFLSLTV